MSSNPTDIPPPDCIVHQVSMMDTLVGVAIKYGVEVEDIKRMNGLITDLQMYALKSLKIPLRRSHAPSCSTSNGFLHHERNSIPKTASRPVFISHLRLCKPKKSLYNAEELVGSMSNHKKASAAMNTLQRYYGTGDDAENGVEMTVYGGGTHNLTPFSAITVGEKGVADEGRKLNEKSIRRRQKEENGSRVGCDHDEGCGVGKSAIAVGKKGVADEGRKLNEKPIRRRQKEENGSGVGCDHDEGCGVGKSASTSSLQEDVVVVGGSSSTSKWNLSDFQALSGVGGMGKPFFDGLSKPIVGLWNKVARD